MHSSAMYSARRRDEPVRVAPSRRGRVTFLIGLAREAVGPIESAATRVGGGLRDARRAPRFWRGAPSLGGVGAPSLKAHTFRVKTRPGVDRALGISQASRPTGRRDRGTDRHGRKSKPRLARQRAARRFHSGGMRPIRARRSNAPGPAAGAKRSQTPPTTAPVTAATSGAGTAHADGPRRHTPRDGADLAQGQRTRDLPATARTRQPPRAADGHRRQGLRRGESSSATPSR
jgi:hypothetical protein